MYEVRHVLKAILRNPDGRILLLTRVDDDENRPGEYDYPGGGAEPNETYEEGVSREIFEETGINIDKKTLKLVYSDTREKNSSKIVIRHVYICEVGKEEVKISNEHKDYGWFTPEEILSMFEHPVYKPALELLLKAGLV